LKDLERQYGKGAVVRLGEQPPAFVETFSTGALTLDLALGGGLPRGRIVEVYGPESSGKTTLALQAIAEVQAGGGVAALIDAEHAFDPDYARVAGVAVDDLVVCQPEHGEMALEVTDQLVRSSAVDLVVVDSVAALVPRAEVEGEMGLQQIGLQARLMSQALRKLATNAARCDCTVLFVNQLRSKVGVIYGSPEVTSGGNALKYYASVRMDIRRIAQIEGRGIRSRVKVVKNKVAPPYRSAEFDILFGGGISKLGSLLDAAVDLEVAERRGAWYSFGEERLGQGRENAVEFLEEHPAVASELEKAFRQQLGALGGDHAEQGEEEGEKEATSENEPSR
jgi:recombination protein RecA